MTDRISDWKNMGRKSEQYTSFKSLENPLMKKYINNEFQIRKIQLN